jgi:hypothetical protein
VTNPADEPREFPVSWPVGVSWSGLAVEPIVGPSAEADLREIRKQHRFLGRRLVRNIRRLPDQPLTLSCKLIRDPPDVGPRYACDLDKGYAAVCWILAPPAELSGAGPRLWIERVILWTTLSNALGAIAPAGE